MLKSNTYVNKVLFGVFLVGWLLSPGVSFTINLGIVKFGVIIINPLDLLFNAYNHFKPESPETPSEFLKRHEEETRSPWIRDEVRQYHPTV